MLGARVATALVLVFSFLAALFWLPATGWRLVVAMIGGLAAWEWGALARFEAMVRYAYGAATALLCWLMAGLLPEAAPPSAADSLWLVVLYGAAVVFWLTAVPLWLTRKWRMAAPLGAAAIGWVVLLPPALALVHVRQVSAGFLLGAMALVWVADIAAYFVGRAFGRHKLAVSISPGKTWEGAAGGALFVLAYGFVVTSLGGGEVLAGLSPLGFAVVLLVLTVISIEGDLFESLLKRQAGIKDSSQLLPGHGGILDRIDSLTSTLPLVALGLLLLGR